MNSVIKVLFGVSIGIMIAHWDFLPVVLSLVLWVGCEYAELRLKQIEAEDDGGVQE